MKNEVSFNREFASAQASQPLPTVGEPLDGRHFLDVVEEQQYSGKPFISHEQDLALGEKNEAEIPKKNESQ